MILEQEVKTVVRMFPTFFLGRGGVLKHFPIFQVYKTIPGRPFTITANLVEAGAKAWK
jgi:hypothetical protein